MNKKVKFDTKNMLDTIKNLPEKTPSIDLNSGIYQAIIYHLGDTDDKANTGTDRITINDLKSLGQTLVLIKNHNGSIPNSVKANLNQDILNALHIIEVKYGEQHLGESLKTYKSSRDAGKISSISQSLF